MVTSAARAIRTLWGMFSFARTYESWISFPPSAGFYESRSPEPDPGRFRNALCG